MTTEHNLSPNAVDDAQQASIYDLIGGAAKLRELVDRFYDLMDLEPQFAVIRALHPTTLDGSRDKFYWFLSGWSGGPDLYIERFGHPRLRARHLPYAIASPERDQWLRCMALAMQDVGMQEWLQERLLTSFFQTADWMRNKADPQPAQ
ncbi:group II truncated hemoglobin [Paraherbaspirillum soli]|uniref:Group II truncated hemoglobin n=1 Tax=Paraherbaspirillum soli TaxID=631222 RepID=A0ABW0MDT8_9BURK